MERVHDPIIFQHALDGIDLKTHIVATYYLSDRLPGVDFIDHFKLIESIAIEGSTGTWQKVKEDSEEVRENLSGKLVGYFEIPSGDEERGDSAGLPDQRLARQRAHDAAVHRRQLLRLLP
jgi:hypothetical protein